jgi:hypothetical protein
MNSDVAGRAVSTREWSAPTRPLQVPDSCGSGGYGSTSGLESSVARTRRPVTA